MTRTPPALQITRLLLSAAETMAALAVEHADKREGGSHTRVAEPSETWVSLSVAAPLPSCAAPFNSHKQGGGLNYETQ